jgi:hypothetical protein
LIEHWTLLDDEVDLVAVKHADTKLAFALLPKFYGRYGRFPRNRNDLHPDAVDFVARAVRADQESLGGYDWSGRTIERHRREIREYFGFRLCSKEDAAKLAEFLAGDVAQRERRYEVVKEHFLAESRLRQLEAPSPDQVERFVRSALFQAAKLLAQRVVDRLALETVGRLRALIGAARPRCVHWPAARGDAPRAAGPQRGGTGTAVAGDRPARPARCDQVDAAGCGARRPLISSAVYRARTA